MNPLSYLAEHFDLPILDFIAEHLHGAVLDFLMPIITLFGEGGIFWILCALLLACIPKYRKVGLSVGAALLIGVLICNVTMKPLIARPRPFDYQLEVFGKEISLLIAKPTDFSFPSGHTLASFEAATVLLLREKKFGIPALVLAILIAFSRMYLYVHYPSDVLTAVVLGVGIGFLGDLLVRKIWDAVEKRRKGKKAE